MSLVESGDEQTNEYISQMRAIEKWAKEKLLKSENDKVVGSVLFFRGCQIAFAGYIQIKNINIFVASLCVCCVRVCCVGCLLVAFKFLDFFFS